VVVTRPVERAGILVDRLRAAGAEAVLYPTIVTAPPSSWTPVDDALRALALYDWVVFTSAAGVHAACARATEIGIAPIAWQSVRIAAVGPATAAALHGFQLRADAVPAKAIGDAIAEAIGDAVVEAVGDGIAEAVEPVGNARFLLLRGDLARNTVADALRRRGGVVHDVDAYRTVIRTEPDAAAADLMRTSDAITFTSPSTLRGFLNALGSCAWSGGAAVVTIGPTTTAAVRAAGLDVHAQADDHTVDGLLAAIARVFEARRANGA
jgi:uroporphyrinogen-III synthase